MPLPPWFPDHPSKDNWQTVARVRAKTDSANPPSAVSGTAGGELTEAVSSFVDHHHDL
jgi:hypothetical protein